MVEVVTHIGVSTRKMMSEMTQVTNGFLPTERDKNVDSKELADRIAAAEAMSCLSNVVLLPSNSEELSVQNIKFPGAKIEDQIPREQDKNNKSSKRGKTKAKGGHDSANQKRENKRSRAKGKTKRHTDNETGTQKGKNATPVAQSQITESTVQNSSIINASKPIPIPIQMALLSKLQTQKLEHARRLQTQQQNVVSTPSSDLVLRLPLMLNKVSDSKGTEVKAEVKSPQALLSNDSVELTQSTVDKLLQIQQNLPSKFDSLESALPLKKRRIHAYQESQENSTEDIVMKESTIDLTKDDDRHSKLSEGPSSSVASPKVNNKEASGDPSAASVNVDPRTSLMLLGEMQMALQQDEDGDLPLHIAVAQENIVMVNKFVHLMTISGKSVDKYNKAQQTPLHLAVELNFVDAVRTLLQAGANPNLVNKRGENSVHLAVKLDSVECLDVMIKHSSCKPDLNTRNFEGMAPLHTATIKKRKAVNMQIVNMLLDAGADINLQDGKSGRTPAFYAVEHYNIHLVELYQNRGANMDLANYAGITAIMAAQARGFQDVASIILKGLDSKTLAEHPQRILGYTGCKKVPIPRIPSKSHLIVSGSDSSRSMKSEKATNNNSTDSNDSQGSKRSMFNHESMEVDDVKKEGETRTLKHEKVHSEHQHIKMETESFDEKTHSGRNEKEMSNTSHFTSEQDLRARIEHEKRVNLSSEQQIKNHEQEIRRKLATERKVNSPSVFEKPQQEDEKMETHQVLQDQAKVKQDLISIVINPETFLSLPSDQQEVFRNYLYVGNKATELLQVPMTNIPATNVSTVTNVPVTSSVSQPEATSKGPTLHPVVVQTFKESKESPILASPVITSKLLKQSSHSSKKLVKNADKHSDSKSSASRPSSSSLSTSAKSSNGNPPTNQLYHLTNISRSTASILAAKLAGVNTAKNNTNNSGNPLNLTKNVQESRTDEKGDKS